MSYYRKYVRLLSALAGEFNEMDFCSYCPTEVINSFWSKHNWKSEDLNIFDLVLLARGNMHNTEYKATDINQFLRD